MIVFVIAVYTGMRLGNILGLTWQDIDLSRNVITLEHTKNGERLGLPMNDTVRNLLVQLNKIRYINSPYVFPTSTGTKFDNSKIGKWFRDACKKTGIQDFRFHDLRHTFASWLVQANVNLYNVQKLLGEAPSFLRCILYVLIWLGVMLFKYILPNTGNICFRLDLSLT